MTVELLAARRRLRDVTTLRGPVGTILALGMAVACTGCTDTPTAFAPAPHPEPTAAGDCNDLGAQRADGFVVAGTDWSGDVHAFDEPAVVHVCVQPGTGGRVSLETSGRGITITPRSRATSSSDTGVLAFHVRVREGATGTLTMRQDSPGASSGGPGPTVIAGTDGWHFASVG